MICRLPLLLLGLLPLLAGCSNNGLAKVSGIVTVGGQPVPSGTIMFQPTGGPAAVGEIKSDGSFTLSTYKPGDGAWIGTHRVIIQATSIGPSSIIEPKSIEDEINPGGTPGSTGSTGEILVPGQVTWLVPEVYSQSHTTPLTAEVTKGLNELKFELPVSGK